MNFVEFVDVDAFPAAARTGSLQRKEAKQIRLDAVNRTALLHRHPLPGAEVIIETASGFDSQPGTFQESTVVSRATASPARSSRRCRPRCRWFCRDPLRAGSDPRGAASTLRGRSGA